MKKLNLSEREKYEIAKQFLQDIIEQVRDDETINMLAICYLELKEYDQAVGLFYKLAKMASFLLYNT